ncbi:serine hydrolase [Azonexus sp.]|uniref:serine hydrolase domain-containing protein n=1 Tax=Azonexus sp. TaxID=1872668 RepID=UPI0027BB0409|nr:serine hydrolase domain-containing protein [Azonexus sp.]
MATAAALGMGAQVAGFASEAKAAAALPAAKAIKVEGRVASSYEGVREAFAAAQADDIGGAQLCVYRHGKVVVDLWCGRDRVNNRPYTSETVTVIFSAAKGMVSTCLHMLAERGLVDIDAPVARYWPEFAANGKESIPVSSLMSHTAGLPWFPPDTGIQMLGLVDWERCTAALAAMKPLWTPETAYQYHSATHGYLLGEIVRRVSGKSVGRFFADEIARPLGLSAWIGLPLSEEGRVAPIFNSNFAGNPFLWFLNLREALMAEIPSGNGVSDARSLARMYAAVIGEVDGARLLSRDTVDRIRAPRTDSLTLVPYPAFLRGLYAPAFAMELPPPLKQRFALGYELPYAASPMLGQGSFGQPGMGGRIGFAHPESGTAVAYVCNNTTWNAYAGPDPRWTPWLDALRNIIS